MDHQFRNAAFGGFNRQDVLDYLETLVKENAQKRQKLEQELAQVQQERDALTAGKAQLEEQIQVQEQEKENHLRSLEKNQTELAALRAQLEEETREARTQAQALDDARSQVEELRQRVARLEPDAAAYAAVKDRSAGVELEAHRRAQETLDQAENQARQLRHEMEQWLARVEREYDALRTEVESTISHAAGELEKAGECLNMANGLMAEQDLALESLTQAYAQTAPAKVAAPMPIPEE